jgi:hypothetical protein
MPQDPEYIYAGQAFDELGSLATLTPNYPRLALDLSTTPGSRDVINVLSRSVFEAGINPYGE